MHIAVFNFYAIFLFYSLFVCFVLFCFSRLSIFLNLFEKSSFMVSLCHCFTARNRMLDCIEHAHMLKNK